MKSKRTIAKALGVLGLALAPIAVSTTPAVAATARASKKAKGPVLKSLAYTPLTIKEEDGYLEARFTGTVTLYSSAPSIYFEVTSTTSNDVSEEIGPEPSYKAGTHKFSFTTTALPGGTYKLTLLARVKPSKYSDTVKSLKGSNPATLVVEEATETEAGAGKITKI